MIINEFKGRSTVIIEPEDLNSTDKHLATDGLDIMTVWLPEGYCYELSGNPTFLYGEFQFRAGFNARINVYKINDRYGRINKSN